MQRRVFNVLLVASPYDAFMMEEDGRVEEQLYNEYVALHLSSPPRITRVSHISEALAMMAKKNLDLVILHQLKVDVKLLKLVSLMKRNMISVV